MKTRILTALILIPLLVGLLISNSMVVSVAVAVVSVIALSELYRATGIAKSRILCVLGYLAGALIPLMPVIEKYLLHPDAMENMLGVLIYLFVTAMLIVTLIYHKKVSVADVGLVIFSLIYIPYFLTNIIYIYQLHQGKVLVWLVFIGAFLTDSCAYFSGVFLGKHKLCPEISPKKTIEGAIGGTLGCVIFYLLYGLLMKYTFEMNINFVKIGVLGLIVAVVSQIGDLSASIIKRHYGIKDYGTLFPGHGGILDRCDSVILVSPVVYLFLEIVGIF